MISPALIQIIFAQACSANNFFFFLPPWYKYLTLRNDPVEGCSIIFDFPGDIWLVVLAIIEMLLRIAGFVAVIMIIFAGVGYILAGGNPEKAASSRKRIYNALIGLAIALVATAFVDFIGTRLIR